MVNRRLTSVAVMLAALVGMPLVGATSPDAAQADAVFDVTDFGATGDGVTDDSEAFRDAIAAADAAAGTNTLLIPAGTYVLDRPADNVIGIIRMDGVTNVDVVGVGPTSIVKWKARNWSTGADPHLFSCDGCSFVSFSDLAVDGTHGEAGFAGQEQMHALFFLNSADITVDNVDFTDTFGDGVAVIGNCGGLTEDVVVSNSTFFSSNRSGIGVQGGTRRMEFVSNHFEAGSDQDIDFEPTGSFPDPDHDNCAPPTEPDPPRPGPEDILIQNNTFLRDEDAACHIVEGVQACTFAVTIGGQVASNKAKRVQLLDNQITDGAVRLLQTDDVTVEGNTLINDVVQNGPLLHIMGSTTGTIVRDNTLQNDNPGKSVIEVIAQGPDLPGDLLIEENVIRQLDPIGDGLTIHRALGPMVIRNNSEISGVGGDAEGRGIQYDLSVSDGILRADSEVTGNTISGFDKAGVQYHTVGTAAFDTVTTCGNTISNAPFGVRFQLSGASSVGEAVVCNNVFGAGVTTKVATDKVTNFRGTGTPEGAVAAPIGSEFIRTDEANRLYVKQTGTGVTGWVGT